jgi:hypothetical protein
MLPAIAAKFSTSELAVLKAIGEEVVKHGICSHAIAAIAGTCRSTAKNAMRTAEALRLRFDASPRALASHLADPTLFSVTSLLFFPVTSLLFWQILVP